MSMLNFPLQEVRFALETGSPDMEIMAKMALLAQTLGSGKSPYELTQMTPAALSFYILVLYMQYHEIVGVNT